MSDLISRCELFNRLATIQAETANEMKGKIYEVIQSAPAIEALEQTEPQTDCCETCKHKNDGCYSEACGPCSIVNSNYEPQTETQTDCSWR